MEEESKKEDKPKKVDTGRLREMEKARLHNKRAAELNERDQLAFSTPEKMEDIYPILKARLARNIEVEVARLGGIFGEAKFNARRVEYTERKESFKNTLKIAFMSALSGDFGIVGEFLSNRMLQGIKYTNDPLEFGKRVNERLEGFAQQTGKAFVKVEESLGDLSEEFKKSFKPIGEKIDEHSKKLSNHDLLLRELEKGFENHTKSNEEKFSTIEKNISSLDTRLKALEVLDLRKRIRNLQDRVHRSAVQAEVVYSFNEVYKRIERLEGSAPSGGGFSSPKQRRLPRQRPPFSRKGLDAPSSSSSSLAPNKTSTAMPVEIQEGPKAITPTEKRFANLFKKGIVPGGGSEARSGITTSDIIGALAGAAGIARIAPLLANPYVLGGAAIAGGVGYLGYKGYQYYKNSGVGSSPSQRSERYIGRGSTPNRTSGTFPRSDEMSIFYERARIEEEKKKFMLYGQLPYGFEFASGHMGRLGMPDAVAARGAQPLGGGYSGGGRSSGGGGYRPGTYFNSSYGAGPSSPQGTGISSSNSGNLISPRRTDSSSTGFVGEQFTQMGSSFPANADGMSRALAEQRKEVFAYLDSNPSLKKKFFAIAANEQGTHAQGVQAVMEETINRAIIRGGNVEEGIKRLEREIRFTSEGGYYDDRHGGQGRAWSTVNNPNNRAIFESAYENVRGGSNISEFAYGNASAGTARSKITGSGGIRAVPTKTINGETFFGPNSDEPLYLKRYSAWKSGLHERSNVLSSSNVNSNIQGRNDPDLGLRNIKKPIYIGDSVAQGYGKASGADISHTKVGRGSKDTLAYIKSLDPESLKGQTVRLSSGLLNSPNDIASVGEQIAYLKSIGANVELVGGPTSGSRSDLKNINPQLESLAREHNVKFVGGYSSNDGVHPSNYASSSRPSSSPDRSNYIPWTSLENPPTKMEVDQAMARGVKNFDYDFSKDKSGINKYIESKGGNAIAYHRGPGNAQWGEPAQSKEQVLAQIKGIDSKYIHLDNQDQWKYDDFKSVVDEARKAGKIIQPKGAIGHWNQYLKDNPDYAKDILYATTENQAKGGAAGLKELNSKVPTVNMEWQMGNSATSEQAALNLQKQTGVPSIRMRGFENPDHAPANLKDISGYQSRGAQIVGGPGYQPGQQQIQQMQRQGELTRPVSINNSQIPSGFGFRPDRPSFKPGTEGFGMFSKAPVNYDPESLSEGNERLFHRSGRLVSQSGAKLDPKLVEVMKAASRDLPGGYRVEMVSGADPRSTGTTNHPNGLAMDVKIFDTSGKEIPFDRNSSGWKHYEALYRSVYIRGKEMYPNEEFIWGGAWISAAAGRGDPMHFQRRVRGIGSQSSGQYSFERGLDPSHPFVREGGQLTPQERAEWDAKVRRNMQSANMPAEPQTGKYPSIVSSSMQPTDRSVFENPNSPLKVLPLKNQYQMGEPRTAAQIASDQSVASNFQESDAQPDAPSAQRIQGGFSASDAQPVSGLQNIAGVQSAQSNPLDVASASPVEVAAKSQDATKAQVPEAPTGPTAPQSNAGSPSGSTDADVPQGGGRNNPETEDASPGSGGYGSKGRCYI